MSAEAPAATGFWTDRRLEGIAVLLLSIASLASAWCGYQAGQADSAQLRLFTEATQARVDAARESAQADQELSVDVALLVNFFNARADGDEELTEFYRSRFPPGLSAAFDAWTALGDEAPSTPFEMPEYRTESTAQARAAAAAAEATYAGGLAVGRIGDRYIELTIVLAGVLFFAGIASAIEWTGARLALLAVAGVTLATALVTMLRLPPP